MEVESRSVAPSWLSGVAISVLVAGGFLTAVGIGLATRGTDARSEARLEAEAQQQLVADAERDLQQLRLEVDVVDDDIRQATATADGAATDQQTARDDLASAQATLDMREALLPERRAELEAFVAAVAAVPAVVSDGVTTGRQMMETRSSQVESALGGDYEAFNRMQEEINLLAFVLNVALDDFDAALAAMPPVADQHSLAGPSERFVGLDVRLDPPTGKARVTATSSTPVIPCTPWGGNGCRFEWTVTFTESNWLAVTIERVAIRYDERGGAAYWYSERGEWRDVDIFVPAGGSATYDGWVQTAADSELGRIIGGKLKFRFEGTDADGNAISGAVTVPLERPGG